MSVVVLNVPALLLGPSEGKWVLFAWGNLTQQERRKSESKVREDLLGYLGNSLLLEGRRLKKTTSEDPLLSLPSLGTQQSPCLRPPASA